MCQAGTYAYVEADVETESRYSASIHNRGVYDLGAACRRCPDFSSSPAGSGFAADCTCDPGYMCFSNGMACKDRLAKAFLVFSQRLCTARLRASLRRQALGEWTVSSSLTVCGGEGGNASYYTAYSQVRGGVNYGDSNFTCDEFLPALYQPNRDRGLCEDVDECVSGAHSCDPLNPPAGWSGASATQVRCANTAGSFTCSCAAGYQPDSAVGGGAVAVTEGGQRLDCVDVDECSEHTHNCHASATCTNTEGSYTCSCNRYFKGDGVVDCWDGQMECRPAVSLRVKTASGDACWAELSNLTSATGGPAAGSYCDDHAGTTGNVFVRFFWLESQSWSEERRLMSGDGYKESAPDLRAGAFTTGVLQGLSYVGTPAMLEYRVEGNDAWHPLTIEVRKYNDDARYVLGDPAGLESGGASSRRLLQNNLATDGMCWVDGDGCVAAGICYTMRGACGAVGPTAVADFDECTLDTHTCHRNATCVNVPGLYRCDCDPGFYGVGTGMVGSGTECSQCSAGKYAASGATMCTACPSYPLSSSPVGSTSIDTCECKAGYYGNLSSVNGTCEECPEDSYCRNGLRFACPADSSSPRLRSVATDCVCNEGFYGDNGGVCTMCPPGSKCIGGWFKETCAAGTYAAAYSTACHACPRNSTSAVGSGFCTCVGGYKTSGSFGLVTNGTCYRGGCAPVTSEAGCTAAAAAVGLGGGSAVASSMPSNLSGAPGCVWDSSGNSLEWVNGSGVCTPERPCVCEQCAERECVACAGGSFAAPGDTACSNCPPRSYAVFPASFIADCTCAVGTFLDGATCAECPEGATSPIGSTSVSGCSCAPGYSGDTDVTNVRCFNSTFSGESCVFPFTFAGQVYPSCTSAVAPGFQAGSVNQTYAQTFPRPWCAISTPPVSRAEEEAFNGTSQQHWYAFCNCTGQCYQCPAGTYKAEAGESPCQACAAGTYSSAGSSSCAQCPSLMSSAPRSTDVSACTCVDGYNESASGDCTDINECDTGSPCDVAAACNNTLGSFTCVCNAGYHGNGSACQACDAGYTCSGGDSAPRMCLAGTYARAAASSCTECPSNGTSANASEFCFCLSGYIGNDGSDADKRKLVYENSTCSNEDECAANVDDCDQAATCQDTVGSFTCTCPEGFPGNGTICESSCGDGVRSGSEQCDDGNADDGDGCEACQVTPGWNCTGSSGGDVCTNLDECVQDLHNCHAHAICLDTHGSFLCACDEDWFGDGIECNSCMPNAVSPVNSTGEDDCSCRAGFKEHALNGTGNASNASFACQDADECVDGTHSCGFGMMCDNTAGSFLCLCMPNFVRVDDNNTLDNTTQGAFHCEDRDECADAALHDCDPNARCNNTVGSFTCECNRGYYDMSLNVTGINGSCLACAPSTYSQELASTSCASCPLNASSPAASVARTNCTCNAGYAGAIGTEEGECARCEAGFFSGPGQTECCACAAGAMSLPASTAATECFCAEGFYGGFEAAGPAGNESSLGNQTLPGNEGSLNEMCDTAGLVCSACPAHASSPQKSHLETNCSCIDGFYEEVLPNATQGNCTECGDCEAGYARVGCGGTSAGRCEDINECSSTPGLTPIDGSNNCDSNARCFNLNNTFECACNAGFYGNGTICKYVLSHTHTHTNSRAFVHALSHLARVLTWWMYR